jgi:hypothetical protein
MRENSQIVRVASRLRLALPTTSFGRYCGRLATCDCRPRSCTPTRVTKPKTATAAMIAAMAASLRVRPSQLKPRSLDHYARKMKTISGKESVVALRRRVNVFGEIGQVAVGNAAKLGSNYFRGKSGAEQAAMERRDLALAKRAANVREVSLESCAYECGFVCVGENSAERGLNMLVGHAARAQLADDAETSLAPRIGVKASEVESVAGVVEVPVFAHPRDNSGDEFRVVGAAREIRAHLVNRVRAAHQYADGGIVQLLFGLEFARRRAGTHGRRIETRRRGRKDGGEALWSPDRETSS